MTTFLLILHILVCLSLIGIVLLQGGKGAEIGATFGAGASQTIFGASGGQSFVAKMTTGAAVIFMLTSLSLAMFWGQPGSESVMPSQVVPPQAQQQAAPTAPPMDADPAAPAGDQPAPAEKPEGN
ncbi:MAG TPA: preprotein translocase subunit SecG [Desulfuromonadales bacterium]|nr:preprotein translocase subunit SecG [Desulfuromonadales bacterium]